MAARKKVETAPSNEQAHHLFARNEPPDIEHVPTVEELAAHGLARVVSTDKGGTYYRLSNEGQQMIYAAMRRNAERRRNAGPH